MNKTEKPAITCAKSGFFTAICADSVSRIKRTISILSSIIILVVITIPCLAVTLPQTRLLPRLVDKANLLSASEEKALLAKLDEISERQHCDVVIVTVYSLGGKRVEAYADDFFDYNGYGYGENKDGILLLLSMEYRDETTSMHGLGSKAISDSDDEEIFQKISADLRSGHYYNAFNTYADECDSYLTNYGKMSPSSILTALVFGIIIAFIGTGIMKGKLKSVRSQPLASNYVKEGSFVLTENRDIFLNKKITSVPIPKSTSSSGGSSRTSSSGRTHTGTSHKF